MVSSKGPLFNYLRYKFSCVASNLVKGFNSNLHFEVVVVEGNAFHNGSDIKVQRNAIKKVRLQFTGLQAGLGHLLPSSRPFSSLWKSKQALQLQRGSKVADEIQGQVLDVEDLNNRKWHFLFVSFEKCLLLKLICGLSGVGCTLLR